jgi:hypothetical protein
VRDDLGVAGEWIEPDRARVKGDQRDVAACASGKEVQQRAQMADDVELQRRVSATLDADNERDRLDVRSSSTWIFCSTPLS